MTTHLPSYYGCACLTSHLLSEIGAVSLRKSFWTSFVRITETHHWVFRRWWSLVLSWMTKRLLQRQMLWPGILANWGLPCNIHITGTGSTCHLLGHLSFTLSWLPLTQWPPSQLQVLAQAP